MFPCSHVPMEIFFFYEMGKKWGNTKRIVFVRGGYCTCVFSWVLGTPLGSCPWVPLPQENALVQEPLLQLYSHCFSMPRQNFVREICHHFLTYLFKIDMLLLFILFNWNPHQLMVPNHIEGLNVMGMALPK